MRTVRRFPLPATLGEHPVRMPHGSEPIAVTPGHGKGTITLWCLVPTVSTVGDIDYSFLVTAVETPIAEGPAYIGSVFGVASSLHIFKVGPWA